MIRLPESVGRWVLVGLVGCLAGLVGGNANESAAQSPRRSQERRPIRDSQLQPAGDEQPKSKAKTAAKEDAAGEERHPLEPVIAFAEESREAMKEVKDYTAVFMKKELVGGQMVVQTMDMKFREKPFSVYFRYRSGQEQGREVLFVAGRNNNNLLVKETGIKAVAGTIPLRPNDPKVMAENRYPITKVGISNILETAFEIWEVEKKFGEVDVKFYPNAKLGEVACQTFEIIHPQPRKEFKYHISRLYFDKKTKLPIRAERFSWPRNPGDKPPLMEEYTYNNLKLNVGLKDVDFDTRNPNYGF